MAGYPYYSPPPPSPPCNDTTPTHPPPPPPPACMCNKTTPTSPSPPPPPPPPSTHYSPPLHSRPPPSHSPPPSPACNETTPTVSPPTFPSLSPPPSPQHLPPPPSPYYSPPQPSLSRPPPRSPPSPSHTPPPRSFSPPPPPPPSIAPPPYPPHKLPLSSPPLPSVPPPCHCVCPSPWAPPPNYQPSIAPLPNYYPSIAPPSSFHPSIAPSPQFLSPSNGHRTVVLTTFVSLGGVFFLAFITIGLLSMAIKKRLPRMPTMSQPGTHEGGQGPVQTFESLATTSGDSVIDIPDQKPIPQTLEESNDPNKRLPQRKPPSSVNDITQGKDQESIGDDSNKKLGKPLDDQNVRGNMDAPPNADSEPIDDEEKLDERNRNTTQDVEQESNAEQGGPDNTTKDVEQESNADRGGPDNTTQDVEQESNADRGGPDNTTQDVEQESNTAEDESNDSKKRLRPGKKNNDRKGKGERKSSKFVGQAMKLVASNFDPDGEHEYQGDDNDDPEVQEVPKDAEDESNANEEKSDERNCKLVGNQSETQDVEQESSAVEKEPKISKERLRPHKRSPSSGLKSKQGERKSSTLVGQSTKLVAINFDPDGEHEYQGDDNDDPEVQEVPQDAEDESNANEEKSDEHNCKLVGNQSETQDVEQESSAVEKESKNSKERLRPHKRSPSGLKTMRGERKSSTVVGQAMKAAVIVDLVGALQPQDYDNDEAEEEQSYRGRNVLPNLGQIVTGEEISGDNPSKEFNSFGNLDDKEEESEAYSSNQDLHRHRRRTSTQGRKESTNFGKNFSATIGANQGEVIKSLNVDQILTTPVGGSDPGLADDDEKEENDEPFNNCDDPSMECESFVDDNAKKEESKSFGSKKVSHLQKSQTGAQRRKEAPNVGQTSTAPLGGDVGVYLKPLADDYEKEENEDPSIECDDPNMEYELRVDDNAKEEKLDSFGSKKDSQLHKSQIGARGRRDPHNVGQIWSDTLGGYPSTYFPSLADDDEKEENDEPVNNCDDPSMECESFVDDNAKKEESKSFGLKKFSHLQKRQTGAQRRKEDPDVGQTSTAPIGGDVGVNLKSLADDYAKEENEDPCIECDDPNMEYELRVDDDAKEEKSDSFGSKKDSRLHKRQIDARGRRDPRNVGQIRSDPLGGDPSTYFQSLADDEEKEENEDQGMECDDLSMEFESLVDDGAKEEESESFGLKKVMHLQKRQIGGHGSKGPPNVGQILNIPTGGDAGEDLKFLADEQKKLELFGRKEVSPLHKRQVGAGGRIEPPKFGQILTARTGRDPGVGLKSVTTQVWASNIGERMTVRNEDDPYGELESHDDDVEGDLSVTATNESDPNAGLGFHEEHQELESECSNKGLGLDKPHALFLGEIEPSIDDQSMFVTGDDDPDESGKVAHSGKPLSRPRPTGVRGKRRT